MRDSLLSVIGHEEMLAVFLFLSVKSSGWRRNVGSRRTVSLKPVDSEAHHTAITENARHNESLKW
jgi:hypothetical protein